jgi:hypothetical protein
MLEQMVNDPQAVLWGIKEWMRFLKCRSKSSVSESPAWQRCKTARAVQRYEQQKGRGEGKRGRRKRTGGA